MYQRLFNNERLQQFKKSHSLRPPRCPLKLESLEDRIAPTVNVWLNPIDGNWSDASNWSDGVPTVDDDVVIDADGSEYTVTVDTNAEVAGLTLGSADATLSLIFRTLTVNGDFNINAGSVGVFASTITGTGTLTNNGHIRSEAGNTIVPDLVNNGTLTVSSTGGSNGLLTVQSQLVNSGTITINNTGTLNRITQLIVNGVLTNNSTGVLTAADDAGSKRIRADVVNNGTVNLNDDVVQLTKANGSFINNATVNVPNTGNLTFGTNSVFTQAGGSLIVNGTYTQVFGTFHFDGGEISGTNPVLLGTSTLNIGGNSTGAATFAFGSTGNRLSGDIAEAQTVVVSASANTSAALTADTGFTNHGTIILNNVSTSVRSTTLTVTN